MTDGQPMDAAIIDRAGLGELIRVLQAQGYKTRGPVVRDGAIVPGDLGDSSDLPLGYHDEQGPGRYRIHHTEDIELFGWAVGPQSLKGEFFPARSVLWRARTGGDEPEFHEEHGSDDAPIAYIGARPCEFAGLARLDRVLTGGSHPDAHYGERRRGAVVVLAECGTPSATCFCTSMGTGPGVADGFDLALTECVRTMNGQIDDDGANEPTYLVRAGSDVGRSLLAQLPSRPVETDDWVARETILTNAARTMGERLDTSDLPALLARNLDHPRWTQVADRCLACGNCTTVCPTCFCSDIHDVSDLSGGTERTRRWSSCFELSHSYLHGGAVRTSTSSRYRQWATHKLSTWHDQFGTSGCVGCGRCIAWCPVGIDITEEVRAIKLNDGAKPPTIDTGTINP